ncbi:hypothetical protein [Flammeovirga aprica]|nr:hypothetical protein [Flammeovirga aprica]
MKKMGLAVARKVVFMVAQWTLQCNITKTASIIKTILPKFNED